MGISNNQLIDIALNVAGSLAAGGLWLVIFSALRKRRDTESVPRPAVNSSRPITTPPKGDQRQAEFVNLRHSPDASKPSAFTRNRAEVIRIAREMLESGSTADKVKELLPISEGELAMLIGR
ncbi:MAG: hypothetical protein AB1644_05485 [Candidatus Zixiibacteriota bacterium]